MDDDWGYPHDLGNLHMMIFPVIQASTWLGFKGIFWNTMRYIATTLWLFNIAMENGPFNL